MPLLGIAIKCEVFMVTGLPFKEVIKQHQRMANGHFILEQTLLL